MKLVRAFAILLALVVAATACGSVQSTTNGGELTSAEDAPDTFAASDALPFDAVLIELFGTNDTDEYLMTVERDAAELVVTCMQAAGFEFEIPAEAVTGPEPEPRSLEDAEALGFGIISGFRDQLEGFDPTRVAPDPNQAYLRTLTAAEIQRFVITLDGVAAQPGQRQEDGGCNGSASEQAYESWTAFFEALPNFTALGEERDTHPGWVATRLLWRDCMTGRGFDYSEPDVIRADVITRMRQTVNEAYPGGDLPLVQVDGEFMVDPAVDELLDELFDFEQAAAVANVECTLPIADDFDTVERQVQQDFIDRNRSTIDELLGANR